MIQSFTTLLTQILNPSQYYRIQYSRNLQNALGALFGAFIAHSIAHNYKKLNKIHNVVNQENAFNLNDGYELTLELIKTLCKNMDDELSDKRIVQIAKNYVTFIQNKPFKLHQKRSVYSYLQVKKQFENSPVNLERLFKNLQKYKQQSDEFLQIIGLAIFYAGKSRKQDIQLQNFIKKIIKLTYHKNNSIKTAILWIHLLQKLINRQEKVDIKVIYLNIKNQIENYLNIVQKQQFNQQEDHIFTTHALKQFINLTQNLQLNNPKNVYQNIIRKTLLQTTDINITLIGAIIGSIVGFKNLPIQYLQKMLVPLNQFQKKNGKQQAVNGLKMCISLFPKKYHRYIKKWNKIIDAKQLIIAHDNQLEKQFNDICIQKDIPRTFPNQLSHFEIQRLRDMLKNIAKKYPKIGYSSGYSMMIAHINRITQYDEQQTEKLFIYLMMSPKFRLIQIYLTNESERLANMLSKLIKKRMGYSSMEQLDGMYYINYIKTLFGFKTPIDATQYIVVLWDLLIQKSIYVLLQVIVLMINNKKDKSDFVSLLNLQLTEDIIKMIANIQIKPDNYYQQLLNHP